jgi:hypothetical protein
VSLPDMLIMFGAGVFGGAVACFAGFHMGLRSRRPVAPGEPNYASFRAHLIDERRLADAIVDELIHRENRRALRRGLPPSLDDARARKGAAEAELAELELTRVRREVLP